MNGGTGIRLRRFNLIESFLGGFLGLVVAGLLSVGAAITTPSGQEPTDPIGWLLQLAIGTIQVSWLPFLVLQVTFAMFRAPLRELSLTPALVGKVAAGPLRDIRAEMDELVTLIGVGPGQPDKSWREPLRLATIRTICQPVVSRALALQDALPLLTGLESTLEVVEVGAPLGEALLGKTILIEQNASYSVAVLGQRQTLGEVFPPIFVCTSRVLEMPEILRLVDLGLLDVRYPVPSLWYDERLTREQQRAFRTHNWLTLTATVTGRLDQTGLPVEFEPRPVNAQQVEKVMTRALAAHSPIHGAADEDRDHLLAELMPSQEVRQALTDILLQVLTVINPDQGIAALPDTSGLDRIHITTRSTYLVWVKGVGPSDVLYRYDFPFARPALVRWINFKFGEAASELWLLDKPAISAAFNERPDDPMSRDRIRRVSWTYDAGDGTPLLPGHGVSFLWHDRGENQGERPAANVGNSLSS